MLAIVASAARTTSGNSGSLADKLRNPEQLKRARFTLLVTAAATEGTDTLDVYVQTTYDGTAWDDVLHFTQVLGNGGAKQFIAEWMRDMAPESEMHAPTDATLAAGVTQGGKLGIDTRVKWVVVDGGGAAASFTFSVLVDPVRDRG